MDRKIKNEIRQRGEQLGGWVRGGCQCAGIGTGISPLHKMIEFRGDIPRGTGMDQSNLSTIIALQQYRRSDEPMIANTLQLLEQCAEVNRELVNLWLYHYCALGSQAEKASTIGAGLRTYQAKLDKAEHLIAGVLVARKRAA